MAGVVRAAGGVVWQIRAGTVEVLVVHRPRRGDWSFPKGKVEPGDFDERHTALREVLEETGYAIETTGLLCVVSGYRLRLEAHYTGRLVGGALRIDREEVLEARFFPPDALPDGILPSHRELVAAAVVEARQTQSLT